MAVLGGHIDVAIANPSEMIANYDAGNLRALALATEERFPPFDNVPTLTELGYPVAPDYWRGIMAAKDVPDAAVKKWNEVMEQVVADPEFIEFLDNANMYNGYMTKRGVCRVSQDSDSVNRFFKGVEPIYWRSRFSAKS